VVSSEVLLMRMKLAREGEAEKHRKELEELTTEKSVEKKDSSSEEETGKSATVILGPMGEQMPESLG